MSFHQNIVFSLLEVAGTKILFGATRGVPKHPKMAVMIKLTKRGYSIKLIFLIHLKAKWIDCFQSRFSMCLNVVEM